MKTTLFVNFTERYLGGGEICKGQENDSWPSHEDTLMDFEVTDITTTRVQPLNEQIVFDHKGPLPKFLWVVVVRYYDGGTFGRTCGYGSIEGVFKAESEAKAMVEAIKNDGYSDARPGAPWVGYFAGLESCDAFRAQVIA